MAEDNSSLVLFLIIAVVVVYALSNVTDIGLFSAQQPTTTCWAFSVENCVQQQIQGSSCPTGYYPTRAECQEQATPDEVEKKDCYEFDKDMGLCKTTGKYAECPEGTYDSIEGCKEEYEEKSTEYKLKQLFTNPMTILLILFILGLIFIILITN